jgi:DhnA family fructose-bisphosphate aldolase class Ia
MNHHVTRLGDGIGTNIVKSHIIPPGMNLQRAVLIESFALGLIVSGGFY